MIDQATFDKALAALKARSPRQQPIILARWQWEIIGRELGEPFRSYADSLTNDPD